MSLSGESLRDESFLLVGGISEDCSVSFLGDPFGLWEVQIQTRLQFSSHSRHFMVDSP